MEWFLEADETEKKKLFLNENGVRSTSYLLRLSAVTSKEVKVCHSYPVRGLGIPPSGAAPVVTALEHRLEPKIHLQPLNCLKTQEKGKKCFNIAGNISLPILSDFQKCSSRMK